MLFSPYEPESREPGSASANDGYIFVSVYMDSLDTPVGVAGIHIGVAWENEFTGQPIKFHILPDTVLGTYALQVPPGVYKPAYSFSNITDKLSGEERRSFPGRSEMPAKLSVGPGQVVYGGHYEARIRVEHGINEMSTYGSLKDASYSRENFEKARANLIMLYPAFNGMEFRYEN
ncbi:MAG: hypothetical protein CMN76_21035 [Spirochaetaceae bacterium]|nr:hypothetical protein [Spirochaetaceae bacterium]